MKGITKKFQLADGREIPSKPANLPNKPTAPSSSKWAIPCCWPQSLDAQEAKENVDFMPLSVEYREKYAAAGRFPGGFFKREARPSDYEILISRLVDRALRPLIPG